MLNVYILLFIVCLFCALCCALCWCGFQYTSAQTIDATKQFIGSYIKKDALGKSKHQKLHNPNQQIDPIHPIHPIHPIQSSMRNKDLLKHPRSKSEQEVINYLEQITGKPFPTVYPKWLIYKGKMLELDGYNEELRTAMEFSGPLHTKWFPQYESYNTYFNRIVNDMVKERLCKKHNVNFFTIDCSLPRHHWKNYVQSRLFDFGLIDKPYTYIDLQKVKPFRNKQLERELNLTEEYIAAKRLN